MPGIATHFRILELFKESRGEEPTKLEYLGAIGPSLGDFIGVKSPSDGSPSSSAYWDVWNELFALLFGYDADKPNVGSLNEKKSLVHSLSTLEKNTQRFDEAIKTRNASLLIAMRDSGDLKAMQKAAEDLKTQLNQNWPAILPKFGKLINKTKSDLTKLPKPESEVLQVRDLLHWRKTGTLLNRFLKAELSSLKDYASGYRVAYAANACGASFINSIVTSPYRLMGWRHRYICNYVDAWVYGNYEDRTITMGGDKPSKPYSKWDNIGEAKLHAKLERLFTPNEVSDVNTEKIVDFLRGFPGDEAHPGISVTLPTDFCKSWFNSIKSEFEASELSDALKVSDETSQTAILTHAALRAWLVLWFQTGSGIEGIGAPPADPGMPPVNVGTKPPWADPMDPADDGTGSHPPGIKPPVPTPIVDDDIVKTICAAIAAILSGIAYTVGALPLALGGIAIAIDSIINNPDEVTNWEELERNVYWYKVFRVDILHSLHEVLVQAGFLHPWPENLEVSNIAVENCKSRKLEDNYPAIPVAVDEEKVVVEKSRAQTELIPTTAYLASEYPSYFIDDPRNGIDPAFIKLVRNGLPELSVWPPVKTDAELAPAQPGNAVLNLNDLVDLESTILEGKGHPDWNLDADRGMSWWTWWFEDTDDTTKLKRK